MNTFIVALWVMACGTDPALDAGSNDEPVSSLSQPPVGDATCRTTDNPLRFRCTVTPTEPGPVTLVLTAGNGVARTFASTEAVSTHEMLVWGLKPETTYTWSDGDASGELSTGSLDDALANANVSVTGTARGFDAVLRPMPCSTGEMYFVMLDGDGDIVWYEAVPEYSGGGAGYDWSADDRAVLVTTPSSFTEVHLSGERRLSLAAGADFEGALHHDVARWQGITYLLAEYSSGDVNVDRIDAFAGTTWLGAYRMEDDFTVTAGAIGDWAHSNGLNVAPTGELVLSTLSFNTLLGIDGDPDSGTFMQRVWHALGSGDGLPDPDYVAEGDARFARQHAASRRGDELYVFDNTGDGHRSRGVRLQMDHDAGVLTLIEDWVMAERCTIHGGAAPLDDGGALVTCANAGDVWAFASGTSSPAWTIEAECGGPTQPIPFTKALPVQFD